MTDGIWILVAHLLVSYQYTGDFTQLQITATALAVLCFDLVAEACGAHDSVRGEPRLESTARVLGAWLVVSLLLTLTAFLTKSGPQFSRVATVTWMALAPATLMLWRLGVHSALRALRRRGYNTRRVAIWGATPVGARLATAIGRNPSMGVDLTGFYDDRDASRRDSTCAEQAPLVGNVQDLVDAARRGELDVVYIALPLRAEARVQDVLRELSDTTADVYMAADFYTYNLLHSRWSSVDGVPVVSIHETPFAGPVALLKRVQDILFTLGILAIVAVPMLAVALAVKLTSRGSVLFRQRRYGLDGAVIDVLKFRSMTVCEDGTDIKQATKNDSRLSPIGGFLRRTSLDELPQLFNVLSGEMSLVGPRPHAVAHNELYRKQIQGYMLRHKVKPGITGWAQVNGWRGETDTLEKMERRIEYDLEYINNWSLFLDIRIIFQTVFGSSVRKNAY